MSLTTNGGNPQLAPAGAWWSDDKTRRKQAELENMIVPAIASLVDRAAAR